MMSDTLRTLDFGASLQDDARELIQARERAVRLHHTGDIRAAGDEVEIPIRNVLAQRLPNAYYVAQGHIVDKTLKVSRQLDAVIADRLASQALLKSQNGTEYLPYESVYAIGEAKSSYKKEHVSYFIETNRSIQVNLEREQTDCTEMYNPIGNPLFSFMLFVNSDNFKPDDLTPIYEEDKGFFTPTVLCLLDRGVIANISFYAEASDAFRFNPAPQFIAMGMFNPERLAATKTGWYFIPFTEEGKKEAASMATLYYMLLMHLEECRLEVPPMFEYIKHILAIGDKRRIF